MSSSGFSVEGNVCFGGVLVMRRPQPFFFDAFMVGGGGGGGAGSYGNSSPHINFGVGGGGGAGQVITYSSITSLYPYYILIGSGGLGGRAANDDDSDSAERGNFGYPTELRPNSASQSGIATALGGGGGGAGWLADRNGDFGQRGPSGGAGGSTNGTGGTAVAPFIYDGGDGADGVDGYGGGGGSGAGGDGSNADIGDAGDGYVSISGGGGSGANGLSFFGPQTSQQIPGSYHQQSEGSVNGGYWAGGGTGGGYSVDGLVNHTYSIHGGGSGGGNYNDNIVAATNSGTNSGGGGGGGGNGYYVQGPNSIAYGGNGGSGVVYIKYPITDSSENKVLSTPSGTVSWTFNIDGVLYRFHRIITSGLINFDNS